MKKKFSLTLDDEFVEFCKLNSIEDIEKYAKQTFKRGFDILKYGEVPMPRTQIIEKNNDDELTKILNENKKMTQELNELRKNTKSTTKQIKDNLYSE
jgi:hypothetical protein